MQNNEKMIHNGIEIAKCVKTLVKMLEQAGLRIKVSQFSAQTFLYDPETARVYQYLPLLVTHARSPQKACTGSSTTHGGVGEGDESLPSPVPPTAKEWLPDSHPLAFKRPAACESGKSAQARSVS